MPNVVPKGSPIWLKNTSYAEFDGHLEKENVAGAGTYNPKTDVGAEGHSQMTHALESLAWSAPFATMRLSFNDGSPDDPTVLSYLGQHGVGPSQAPTVTRLGDGYCSVEFESSYLDSYGRPASVSISQVQLTAEGASVSTPPSYILASGQTVYLYGETDGALTATFWTFGD